MPARSKFQPEEKELIVNEYLAGTFGVMELSSQYNVDPTTLYQWIRLYQSHGIDGITPKSIHKSYSSELKANAVMDFQSGNLTRNEICTKYDIKSITQLKSWVKRYTNHELTKSSHSGGTKLMTKGRKTTRAERIEIVAYCIEHGKDYAMTIKKYEVSYQQVYSWVSKYTKNGIDGLSDRRGKPKDKNSMTDLEKSKAESRLLQAQLKEKEMENDLLKKVMEIERRRD